MVAATAVEVTGALTSLFVQHGPPLVLKSDNGSAFGAGVVQELLAGVGVIPLFSPPYWPRDNGSIEAGIGAMKSRTERQGERAGRARQVDWPAGPVSGPGRTPRQRGRKPTRRRGRTGRRAQRPSSGGKLAHRSARRSGSSSSRGSPGAARKCVRRQGGGAQRTRPATRRKTPG